MFTSIGSRLATFLAVAFLCQPFAAAKSYRFTKLIDNSWTLPQGDIWGFSDATISDGIAAFGISFDFGTHYGVFSGNGSGIENLVNTGDMAPVDTFKYVYLPIVDNGEVAFYATYSGDSGTFTGEKGIFITKNGSLTPIVKTGDAGPTGDITRIDKHSMSHGTIAFTATYGAGVRGILTSKDGVLSTIAQNGDPAPVGTFRGFSTGPAISGDNVAFVGQYNGLTGAFRSDGQDLVKIVQSGDAAPVGTFSTGRAFDFPAISGENVAFVGFYGEAGRPTNSGIFVGDGGPLRVIAKTGDTTSNGVFTGFHEPSIAGEYTAFVGTYSNSGAYPHALFVADGSRLSSLIATGDSLFGSTVMYLDIGRFGLDDSANGTLVFQYNLSDGRSGLAIASIVPEPGTLVFIITAIAFVISGFRYHEKSLTRC
jgi:hypothetical protein